MMPKEKRIINFLNWRMDLRRSGADISKNCFVVDTEQFLTKPEIKQYLEKVYRIEPLTVRTTIMMGKFKQDHLRSIFNLMYRKEENS